jgi:pilus assembly protein CpaB
MKRLGSTLILAILAAALAGAGAWLVNRYVSTEKARATTKAKIEVEGTLTKAVFTKAEVPVNTPLKPEMFEIKQTPKKFMPKDAIVDIKELEGLYSKMPLVADELVRAAKVGGREQLDSLAFRLPKGKRAVSINTSPSKAVAYAINPGDHVDVIALIPVGTEGDKVGKTVLQDVEVIEISTGRQAEPADGASAPSGASMKRATPPTATLALYPNEAEVIALAETSAELVLSLRGADDRDAGSSSGITLSQMVGLSGSMPTEGASGMNIEVFYGDKKTSYMVPGAPKPVEKSEESVEGHGAPPKAPKKPAKVEVIEGGKQQTVTVAPEAPPEPTHAPDPVQEEQPPQFESTLPRSPQ